MFIIIICIFFISCYFVIISNDPSTIREPATILVGDASYTSLSFDIHMLKTILTGDNKQTNKQKNKNNNDTLEKDAGAKNCIYKD